SVPDHQDSPPAPPRTHAPATRAPWRGLAPTMRSPSPSGLLAPVARRPDHGFLRWVRARAVAAVRSQIAARCASSSRSNCRGPCSAFFSSSAHARSIVARTSSGAVSSTPRAGAPLPLRLSHRLLLLLRVGGLLVGEPLAHGMCRLAGVLPSG